MTDQQPHTPTTDLVSSVYVQHMTRHGDVSVRQVKDEFDRMIAAAEQRGAIKALRDAEEVIDAELQDSPAPNYEEDNYDAGRIDGLTFSQEHLRNRADQIEGDDASSI